MQKVIEDYVPKLRAIGILLMSIDANGLDAQEVDYIDEIAEIAEYFIATYEGEKPSQPHMHFLGE